MEMFKELYMGNVSEITRRRRNTNPENEKKEKTLYETLINKLSDEDRIIFDDFIEAYGTSFDDEMEDRYIQGLKTGILIGVEACNLDF